MPQDLNHGIDKGGGLAASGSADDQAVGRSGKVDVQLLLFVAVHRIHGNSVLLFLLPLGKELVREELIFLFIIHKAGVLQGALNPLGLSLQHTLGGSGRASPEDQEKESDKHGFHQSCQIRYGRKQNRSVKRNPKPIAGQHFGHAAYCHSCHAPQYENRCQCSQSVKSGFFDPIHILVSSHPLCPSPASAAPLR